MRVPATYKLVDHLQRIKDSDAFKTSASAYGERSKEYLAEIQIALKQQIETHGSDDLAKFEAALTANALKQAASKMATV